MVSCERSRRRPAGDGLHHGRFHFEIATVIEELAQRLQRSCALHKDFAAVEIGKQIDVALAVAQFDVR